MQPILHQSTLRPIDELIPYERNSKLHTDQDVVELAEGIKKNGFIQPIVVDANDVIITGHKRRLAALHLGLKEVPVVKVTHLSEHEAAALRLFDNRVSEGPLLPEMIRFELGTLSKNGIDLALAGYALPNIDVFLDTGTLINGLFDRPRADVSMSANESELKEKKPQVRIIPGDSWELAPECVLTVGNADKPTLKALGKLLLRFAESTGHDPVCNGEHLSDRYMHEATQ
jgi:hypothetical protein